MNGTPVSEDPWVIRTDFANDKDWIAIKDLIAAPQHADGFEALAYVEYVSDDTFSNLAAAEIVRKLPDTYPQFFCFVVDSHTLTNTEHPVLVVGFYPEGDALDVDDFQRTPRQTPAAEIHTFRALPASVQSIENNLSIANMDFEDFADSVDADGIFRRFTR
ncbi:MAG: hypothetical protein KDA58_03605 [Planctomycetaceae bacterium]|nr:hypothetical protein [Planctomycetaceae bacterium]